MSDGLNGPGAAAPRLEHAVSPDMHRDGPVAALRHPGLRELLVLLLATDLLLTMTHLLHTLTPYFADPRYSLEAERGYPEIVQYVKWYWTALGFLWLAWRVRESRFVVWALIFGYLLIDDSFELHEKVGLYLAERFGFPAAFGLRPQDFGELSVSALAGSAALILLAIAYASRSPLFRAVTHRVVLLIAFLALFGLGVDMAHVAFSEFSVMNQALAVLEDGGEMIVVSVLCWYTVRLLISAPPRPAQRRRLKGQPLTPVANDQ